MGYKYDFVSQKLNITRQTLNNYINGITLIDIEKLIKLSELLKRNIDYFYKDNFVFGNYLFRSDSEVDNITKVKFEERIRKYLEVEKLVGKKTIPYMLDVYLEKLDKEFIETIAQNLRRFWNIGLLEPINNPINLLELNGIKVLQFSSPDHEISGFSAFNDKIGYCIYLNSNNTIERQFFTSIHELAHFIFNRKDYGIELSAKENEGKEKIANYFAGVFLVPKDSLNKFVEENYFKKIDFEEVCLIKKYFNVSAECIIKRLFQEGKIDKANYEMLRNEANEKVGSFGEREPIEKKYFIDNFRFNNLVKNAYMENRITTSKLAELLNIRMDEANREAEKWLN